MADIAKFEEEYKGSEEELADLKAAYLDGDGDMDYIMDNVLCATQDEDEARFSDVIKKWIAAGDVPDLKKFSKGASSYDVHIFLPSLCSAAFPQILGIF